jgi:hypothetical protein
MGAEIAALYGTDDDDEITEIQRQQYEAEKQEHLTGMDEEQRDWDSDEEQ